MKTKLTSISESMKLPNIHKYWLESDQFEKLVLWPTLNQEFFILGSSLEIRQTKIYTCNYNICLINMGTQLSFDVCMKGVWL